MPAPIKCEAEINILVALRADDFSKTRTSVSLECNSCPVGKRIFSSDPNFQDQDQAVKNTRFFLSKGCGLRQGNEIVILPYGL